MHTVVVAWAAAWAAWAAWICNAAALPVHKRLAETGPGRQLPGLFIFDTARAGLQSSGLSQVPVFLPVSLIVMTWPSELNVIVPL
jgi:hypothetical protein